MLCTTDISVAPQARSPSPQGRLRGCSPMLPQGLSLCAHSSPCVRKLIFQSGFVVTELNHLFMHLRREKRTQNLSALELQSELFYTLKQVRVRLHNMGWLNKTRYIWWKNPVSVALGTLWGVNRTVGMVFVEATIVWVTWQLHSYIKVKRTGWKICCRTRCSEPMDRLLVNLGIQIFCCLVSGWPSVISVNELSLELGQRIP